MARRKPKTRIERIADSLLTTDLRLRLVPELGEDHRNIALRELKTACKELTALIKDVRSGEYP